MLPGPKNGFPISISGGGRGGRSVVLTVFAGTEAGLLVGRSSAFADMVTVSPAVITHRPNHPTALNRPITCCVPSRCLLSACHAHACVDVSYVDQAHAHASVGMAPHSRI